MNFKLFHQSRKSLNQVNHDSDKGANFTAKEQRLNLHGRPCAMMFAYFAPPKSQLGLDCSHFLLSF